MAKPSINTLLKYKPIIEFGGEFYKILGETKPIEDKTKLGYLVKWYGGDKVLGYADKLLICETIIDANVEYYE